MSSKRYYTTVSDDSLSYEDSYSSSSESDYHSKRSKKRKRSKHSKHKSKSKHKRRHKKHKKEKTSKHKKDRKSKSKKRKQTNEDCDDHEPLRKKRKLSINSDQKKDNNPCTSNKELIQNAKTVLKMLCNDDETKEYMINIFTKLDNKESISISDHCQFKQALEMIFTFLLLNTSDNNTYNKTDDSLSLLRTFKKQLKLSKPSKSKIQSASFIGPAMPPSDYKSSNNESSNNKSSGIIGVTMPTNDDLLNNKYSSDDEHDDDDLYGPAAITGDDDKQRIAQMQHTKIIAEMNKKIKGDDINGDKIESNDKKRPEWMTQMPTSLMSDYDKGTKARGFKQHQHKQDNSWTETPQDIKTQKKEKKRRQKIENEYNEKLKNLGLPTIQEQNKKEFEEEIANKQLQNDKLESQERPKSLFEIHQEKLREDFKFEMKEWKRAKKNGEKVGPKPVFKGAKIHDRNANYSGSMDSYYNAQNPVFQRSKLNSFVCGGTIDNY